MSDPFSDHGPYEVTISKPFWILNEPVTQTLWTTLNSRNPSYFRSSSLLPVEQVSYFDALDFCTLLDKVCQPIDGWHFTLPAEAQWEYAARAGATSLYYWGSEWDSSRANADGSHSSTSPVDRYRLNPWGLYDVHGNVWEWCRDRYTDYLGRFPLTDPEGPSALDSDLALRPEMGRVIRGGSWKSSNLHCRLGFRTCAMPNEKRNDIGFRPALVQK